ncbi:hypothetical protein C8Q72DRAFT_455120 [Fomitopsis betulina]|nr:hypothetical protein C8Q72DRAFT_455120 [Fomitopsis betulina]
MNSPRATLDPSISLCLACSASLPPRKALASPTAPKYRASNALDEIFMTECCQRPICPACVSTNPRLARYNPCLHCLGGVGAIRAAVPVDALRSGEKSVGGRVNVDGGVEDEDVYVLGDDDEDEEENTEGAAQRSVDGKSAASDSPPPATPPPAYSEITSFRPPHQLLSSQPLPKEDRPVQATGYASSPSSSLQRYYIQSNDTLIGIALRFRIDGQTLCRLNDLPLSTLRTTPHLLHTRTSLVLPASAASGSKAPVIPNKPSPGEEARRARERAESRFRVLTKEADYRVARAYVAIAGVEDDTGDALRNDEAGSFTDASLKRLVHGSSVEADGSLEGRAVDRYLDDEEWEERQRSNGGTAQIPAFPVSSGMSKSSGKNTWWRW